MRKQESEKLIHAYEFFVDAYQKKKFVEITNVFGTDKGIKMPEHLLKELEPFLWAITERKYKVGEVEMRVWGNSPVSLYTMTNGECVVSVKYDNMALFLGMLHEMVEHAVNSRTARKHYHHLKRN